MIFISSDHGGLDLKGKVVKHLVEKEIEVVDLGPVEFNPNDDYPDYVKPLIKKVLTDKNGKGILICRNGVGVCMSANRHKGIRAGLSWNYKHVASSRTDDNTNILCLPADYIQDQDAIKTVETWLETPFANEERFVRRIKKAD